MIDAVRAGLLLVAVLLAGPLAATAQPTPAIPLDGVTAIVEALKTHDVVALGEGNHGNEQGAAFRAKLYADPRFLAVVNDIVVESGNARHQAMMDRYIAGEDVPEKELRMAWLETTAPNDVWDRPIYADMFRTIREINKTLPKEKRLRVLLGDDWYDSSAGPPKLRADASTVEIIEREVVARKRKALVVYGGMHLLRKPLDTPVPPGETLPFRDGSITSLLEKDGVKVFVIWQFTPSRQAEDLQALQPDAAGWAKGSLAMLKGTVLGEAPFTFYYPKGFGMTVRPSPAGPVRMDLGEAIGGTLQDQVDALLYIGPKADITYSQLPPSLCKDPEYVEFRAMRLGTQKLPGGGSPADDFRKRCELLAKAN
jgi:hypothetical protein